MSEFVDNMIAQARARRQELRELIEPALAELGQIETLLETLDAAEEKSGKERAADFFDRNLRREAKASIALDKEGDGQTVAVPSEGEQRQQVIEDLEPRICALEGCNNDISDKSPTAKYCSRAHKIRAAHRRERKKKAAETSVKPTISAKPKPVLSPQVQDRIWLALREFPTGATTNTIADVGIKRAHGEGNVGRTGVMYALKELVRQGRATIETKKLPIKHGQGSRLMEQKIYHIVPPQLKHTSPPDPTSRPRYTPPEVEVRSTPMLRREGSAAPTGSYPSPKEAHLAAAVRKAVAQKWTVSLNGKGDHQLRCVSPTGQVVFVPRNFTGPGLGRRVISEFRKAGIDA